MTVYTETFEAITEGLEQPRVCEDEYAEHGSVEAKWYTTHDDCGYFICDDCKRGDQKAISETIANGYPLWCGMCDAEGIDPHSVKFIHL